VLEYVPVPKCDETRPSPLSSNWPGYLSKRTRLQLWNTMRLSPKHRHKSIRQPPYCGG